MFNKMHRLILAAVLLALGSPALAARLSSATTDQIISPGSITMPSVVTEFFRYNPANNPTTAHDSSVVGLGVNGVTEFNFGWDQTATADQRACALYTGSAFEFAQVGAMTTGSWAGVACKYDGTHLTAWLNGALAATIASAAPAASVVAQAAIFKDEFGEVSPEGTISQPAFWNVALSTQELVYLAGGGNPISVRPTSLIEYLPVQNSDTADHGPNNLTQTVSGTSNAADPSGLYGAAPAMWLPNHITMSAFRGPSLDDNLYQFDSVNGVNFTYRPTNYSPSCGAQCVRDPAQSFINGKALISFTNAVNSCYGCTTSIQLAVSTDKIGAQYNDLTTISASSICISGCDTWNGSLFKDSDGSVHATLSIGPTGFASGMQCYESHPTNAAMTTWSAPVKITGTLLPLVIYQCNIYKIGSTYYLFYANYNGNGSTEPWVEYATSSSLTSGYTVQSTNLCPYTPTYAAKTEGGQLLNLGNEYVLYTDNVGGGVGYCTVVGTNFAAANWSAAQAITVNGSPDTSGFVVQGPTISILNPNSASPSTFGDVSPANDNDPMFARSEELR